MGAWEWGRAFWAMMLGLLIVGVIASASLENSKKPADPLSSSPYNPGPGGTSAFVVDISRKYPLVLTGDVNEANRLSQREHILLIIIGPDTPFNYEEASIIREMVVSGRADLIVADETPKTRPILKALGLPEIDGIQFHENASGDWRYIVGLKCNGYSAYGSLAAAINASGSLRVLCTYETGSPAAALFQVGKGEVLVVGDSSIFANFLYLGEVSGLPSTRQVALYLVSSIYKGGIIVVEDSHYSELSVAGATIPARILRELTTGATGLSLMLKSIHPVEIGLLVLSFGLPWAAILLYPHGREPEQVEELDLIEQDVLELEAARIGVLEKCRKGDIGCLARRIMEVLARESHR